MSLAAKISYLRENAGGGGEGPDLVVGANDSPCNAQNTSPKKEQSGYWGITDVPHMRGQGGRVGEFLKV